MDEIALLQAQLAAVQQQESALKLSEHNVIDLLLRLQQLGKVQVVHSLTGKELLTPLQIERELEDLVALGAGRASLAELQRVVNVDRAYVDRHVAQLARGSHRRGTSYFVVNSGEEVVTGAYLDAIMEDTDALLQESGTTTIGELAQQYGFAVDFMKEVVQARLGSLLHAQERGNVLYTDAFVAAQKAQVRGAFAGVTRPTFVPDLVRAYGFDAKVVDESLAEMLRAKVLMGALRGREFVPFVFIEAQRESMYSFFQQNGYLEHARAAKLQVARPYNFLKSRFPDAVPLNASVVSAGLQLQLEGSIEAAITEGALLDAATVVPSGVSPSDVALLLRKSPLLESKKAFAIRDVYVVSSTFIDECVAKLTEDAAQKARKAAAEQQQQQQQSGAARSSAAEANTFEDSEDEDTTKRGGRKGKRAGKKGNNAPSEEVASSKSKGGAKGKRGKRGGNDDAPTDSKRKTDKSSKSTQSITPSREDVAALLGEWFSQLEDYKDDEDFMDGLAEHLEPDVDRVYSSALAAALSSILRGDAASLRDLRKKFEDRFDELLSPLLVLEKGFNKLEMHVDAKDELGMQQLKVIETHILDTAGTELAALVTSFVAEANSVELEGVPAFSGPMIVENHVSDGSAAPEANAPVVTSLTEANKKLLEKNLPSSTAAAVVRLWTLTTAGRRSFGDFMVHVPALAEALSMPLRKFDRKKERLVVFGNRHGLIEQLDRFIESCEAVPATAVALQLLFQQCTNLIMRLPLDHIEYATTVLKSLESSVAPEAMQQFQRLAAVANNDSDDEQTQLLEAVRGFVTTKGTGAAS